MSSTQETWPWQRLNEGNASAHEVLTILLDPQPGERWLDVGTGGGGLAFQLARTGADVVGVDVAEDGLAHAREAAAAQDLAVELLVGDAQALPFEDASFDGVASAFGAIFAPDQERAARELARVCRPGGRLGMTLMPLDSRTGQMFAAATRFGREGANPAEWEGRVRELLGDAFELEIERRESSAVANPPPTGEQVAQMLGLFRELVARLDEDAVAALRAEFESVQERYRDRPPSYVVVLGRRR